MTLFEAIEARDLTALRQALRHAVDVNPVANERTTPLIDAARVGWLEGVQALLEAGAEAGWKDAAEETALLKAAANGHASVVRVLAPLAGDEERDMAGAFLAAYGASHAPYFSYDESRLKHKAVELAARAADLVGHEEPLQRVQRADRAKKNQR